jgi:4-hydroxy-2-oxoheptanedioate aldolase
MRANRVREIWQSGGAVINGWCGIPGGFIAEVMAHLAPDSLVIDCQHGVIGYADMLTMLQAISTTAVMPMVRVPWNEPGTIMKALDAGAYGVICPMINSRAECEAFVGACRYAPLGYRSSGPIRATLYGGPEYHAKANETVIAMAMIETRQALDRVDEIMSTPGLDGIYVGPSDLSISLGHSPGQDKTDAYMIDALTRILDASARHGLKTGIHTASTTYAKRMIAMGFDFVTAFSDLGLITAGGARAVAEMRDGR